MARRVIFIVASFTVFIVILVQTAMAQSTTPTPAPSKTPTLAPTATPEAVLETETPESLPETNLGLESFVQADLTVLTGNVQRPNGIVWLDGRLYISCTGDWSVYDVEAETGSTELYIFGLRNAHAMYAENDLNGELNLWAPDFERNVLVLITRNGFGTITTQLNGPWGIAYVDQDTFLVSNLLDDNIVRVTRDGVVTEFLSGLRSPTGIAIGGDYIYVANNGSARRGIEWTTNNPETNVASPAETLVSGLQNTTDLVMGSDGYLYFAYSLGTRGVVGRVDPEQCRENGGCTNDQVEIVVYSDLAAPLAGLAISPDMRLFVHTIYRPEIYWVQLDQRP
jgi:glucose/arabinose dehydrogenase